jgi:hypothetical protein
MEFVYPEAIRCEENGKRISQEVVDKLRYASNLDLLSALTMLQRDELFGYAPGTRQAPQRAYFDGWHREA